MDNSTPTHPVFAQLSFAPATKTTTITTTTTTTTSFPPFLLKAPQDLLARDPRQYPLAAAPTPTGLKHFIFSAGGRVACFDEDSNLGSVIEEDCGSIKNLEHTKYKSPANLNAFLDLSSARKRAASEASDDGLHYTAGSQHIGRPFKKSRHRLRGLDNMPITPRSRTMTRTRRYDHTEQTSSHQQSPISLVGSNVMSSSRIEGNAPSLNNMATTCPSPDATGGPPSPPSFLSISAGVATPPIVEQDLEAMESFQSTENEMPTVELVPQAVQDNSLPSPMLSPVTAAASPPTADFPFEHDGGSFASRSIMPLISEGLPEETRKLKASTPLPDLYKLVDTFDSYPVELQRYVMYQLLRRSNKSILQFTADLVNPALKCDYLTRLPTELSLNVIRHLDAISLCRAAQVSRRWRELIDGDDNVWKSLIVKEDFTLNKGELERAVREGWKWQGLQSTEEDLSAKLSCPPSNISSIVFANGKVGSAITFPTTRGFKRRAEVAGTSNKRGKMLLKQDALAIVDDQHGRTYSRIDLQALTADIPELGLKSLRIPHLYKSIFRRHYGHRSSWMDKKTKPHHIAFRAHGRNVVTCLQFDHDKILTGSDDTKINVWDANTGASRAQLNGHEGGVWALQYDGNTLVSGSTDRTVRIWDIAKGRCLHTFHGHTSTVRCLVILQPAVIGHEEDGTPIMMPKEPLIITGSRDATLRIWKLPKVGDTLWNPAGADVTGQEINPYYLRTLTGHVHSVRALAAHGDTLVSGSYDATVRVWRISTGDLVHRLNGHLQKVYSVVLDHERDRCISGSMDNLVKVWSLETGQCIFNLEGHTSLVGLLDLNNDFLVSAAADWSLRVWDPETGLCKNVLSAHTGAITCFQHDARKVVSGSDRTLKLWDMKTGEVVRDLLTDLTGGWQVKFNDRKCVAAVQRNNHTFIEVLDFGAARDGVPAERLGHRILVDENGDEIGDTSDDEDLDE